MLAAVLEKLGKQDESLSPESRMEALIGQMEVLLSGATAEPVGDPAPARASGDITGLTARDVIAQMVAESKRQRIQSSNKAIASRLIELGIRPARGKTWTTSIIDNIKRRMKHLSDVI
ncbi:recombinase family protein [Rahnella sp. CJA17(1/100)]|uniref:recombinase family protein n=1 Tax=Rahnella sp. CJA17(1/100) TaxID=2508951 RepID=UPI001F0DEFA1|nr:recombinase family protein [Rahnella sp. CJA17(1/100)]